MTAAPATNPPPCGGCRDCAACLAPLPLGKTCADCAHIKRCDAFGFHGGAEGDRASGHCSFVPSRWLARGEQ